MAATTDAGKMLFIAMADWKAEPEAESVKIWADSLRAETTTPREATCKTGSQIDFLRCSKVCSNLVRSVAVDWEVPFAPHAAICVRNASRAVHMQT